MSAEEDAEQVLAAAELLADAIRAGRLPRKPRMETLARIAAIITTAQPRQTKTKVETVRPRGRGGSVSTTPKVLR